MKKELYASLLLLLVFISCSAMYRGAERDTAQLNRSGNNKCIAPFASQHDLCYSLSTKSAR
jgi:hypothetical protein